VNSLLFGWGYGNEIVEVYCCLCVGVMMSMLVLLE